MSRVNTIKALMFYMNNGAWRYNFKSNFIKYGKANSIHQRRYFFFFLVARKTRTFCNQRVLNLGTTHRRQYLKKKKKLRKSCTFKGKRHTLEKTSMSTYLRSQQKHLNTIWSNMKSCLLEAELALVHLSSTVLVS